MTGVSATIGRAEDNQIIVEREGVGDYQGEQREIFRSLWKRS